MKNNTPCVDFRLDLTLTFVELDRHEIYVELDHGDKCVKLANSL
jgi:hypothetical protein